MPERRHRQELFWRPAWSAPPAGRPGLIRGALLLLALGVGIWALRGRRAADRAPIEPMTETPTVAVPDVPVAIPQVAARAAAGRRDPAAREPRPGVATWTAWSSGAWFACSWSRTGPTTSSTAASRAGLVQEYGAELERRLNARFKTGARPVQVFYVPVGRDELLPALEAGRGDIAAANLTVTPERRREVDFSAPFSTRRPRDRRHRPGLAAAGDARRPGRAADPGAPLEQLLGQPRGPRSRRRAAGLAGLTLDPVLGGAGGRGPAGDARRGPAARRRGRRAQGPGLGARPARHHGCATIWSCARAARSPGRSASTAPSCGAFLDGFAEDTAAGTTFGNLVTGRYLGPKPRCATAPRHATSVATASWRATFAATASATASTGSCWRRRATRNRASIRAAAARRVPWESCRSCRAPRATPMSTSPASTRPRTTSTPRPSICAT